MATEKDSGVTAGSAIKALQEASEKICAEDYQRMKIAFLLSYVGMDWDDTHQLAIEAWNRRIEE